ncbi:MGMT family protein [Candidatus Woesearchaeota archaeon]|nr:MGMT family protein [Candidatus Woesearchaeota archaeon]
MDTWNHKADSGSKLFNERVYELLRRVPAGKVTTYAELAHALGTKAYRAVGNAMNKNPYAPLVPCHRVVKSDGCIGGFALGCEKKIALLEKEGVYVKNGKIVGFDKKLFRFDIH